MPKREVDIPVRLSLLDRLIDANPRVSTEPLLTRSKSLRELKTSLKRDLEWLLNTRRMIEQEGTASVKDVQRSLYGYGLPDICSLSLHSNKDQNRLLRMIESAVTTFEPRLAGVSVVMEPVGENARVLRFVITGLLRIDPVPEPVSFDTVLEVPNGIYKVKGDASAG